MKLLKRAIARVQNLGVDFEKSYQSKKDLISYNTTFLWTITLIVLNVFISYASNIRYVATINACGALAFSALLVMNRYGFFKYSKHLGIVIANVYVYFQCLASGADLQFQYAYFIILTMIGLVVVSRRHLFIHLPITIVFFILAKISYHYFEPWENIPLNQRDYFAFNNGIIFLLLISICVYTFRNQTNIYLLEIEQKKNLIEEKQKEIYDSITYARRIQQAVLANRKIMEDWIDQKRYFVLFKPKDIVSGDFYWATYVKLVEDVKEDDFIKNRGDELLYFAVCDSTGHGVPGAFMSLLNMRFLSEAIKEKHLYAPNQIFDYVRERLVESISDEGQKDGFDGVLVCLNKTTGKIFYAAANNNPVLISSDVMTHLPADKMPVGQGEKKDCFKLYTFDYKVGDMLYLYTDGFADQFGGPKGKKFKYRQLEELILSHSKAPLPSQKHELFQAFSHWKGQLEQVDDVCVAGIAL